MGYGNLDFGFPGALFHHVSLLPGIGDEVQLDRLRLANRLIIYHLCVDSIPSNVFAPFLPLAQLKVNFRVPSLGRLLSLILNSL